MSGVEDEIERPRGCGACKCCRDVLEPCPHPLGGWREDAIVEEARLAIFACSEPQEQRALAKESRDLWAKSEGSARSWSRMRWMWGGKGSCALAIRQSAHSLQLSPGD